MGNAASSSRLSGDKPSSHASSHASFASSASFCSTAVSEPTARERVTAKSSSGEDDATDSEQKPHSLSEVTISSNGDTQTESPTLIQTQTRDHPASATKSPPGKTEHKTKNYKLPSPSISSAIWDHMAKLPRYLPCATRTWMNDNSPTSTSSSCCRSASCVDTKYMIEERHRAFWELVQKILVLNDVAVMVRLLLDYLATQMPAYASAVFLIDQNTHIMSRVLRGQGSMAGIDPSRGLVGHTLASKVPICVTNFEHDIIYDREIDLPQEMPNQKLFCVPLIENGNVYAVVEATTSKPSRKEIDDVDMKVLTWLGPILAACMRKCIEFHDVLLSERTQKALLHIISSSDTGDTVLNLVDGVIAGACHITKAERISLFMVDWETNELWSLSSSYHEETLRVPIEGSILGFAAKKQATLNIFDPKNDPRFHANIDQRLGIDTRCALYVPVGVQNGKSNRSSRPIAVLEIVNKEEGQEFTFDDEYAFEAFSCEVAVILRRRTNEIEYIKLLADTRAEKVLAQRATSQVNLLEAYTSYSSMMKGHPADCLRHSFVKSQSKNCSQCAHENSQEGMPELRTPRRLYQMQSSPVNSMTNFASTALLGSWEFNVFALDSDSLPKLIEDMYLSFNLDRILDTTKQTLRNFIQATKQNYHPNPFHNFTHAFSVVHAAYLLLSTTGAAEMLLPMDIAACMIAALCHDVDHPGHTNSFEIISGSQLALLYSDESVLEHHHAYTTFRIMNKEKNVNVLRNLSKTDYRHVRKMIITSILGTDMANHFKFCELLEKTLHPSAHHLETNPMTGSKRDLMSGSENGATEIHNVVREAVANTPRSGMYGSIANAAASQIPMKPACYRRQGSSGWVFTGTVDERFFLVKTLIHASDLSGQVFTKPVALKWSNMIAKEFAYQALLEQAEGLAVSYQHLDDPLKMVESQLFFAQKIVSPLWDLMFVMFPELDVCVQNLADNVDHYEQELERLKLQYQLDEEEEEEEEIVEEELPAMDSVKPRESMVRRESILRRDSVARRESISVGRRESISIGRRESISIISGEDEGLAVPGLARCTPAKFNSFRSTSDTLTEAELIDARNAAFGASAIEAVNKSRRYSNSRSRSGSSSSNSSSDGDDVDVVEVVDADPSHFLLFQDS